MADLLWHYTTGAGLRGILETNVLWATDVRYLNDESELQYAVEPLDGAFDEGLALLPLGSFKDWIATLKSQLERFETLAVFAVWFPTILAGDPRIQLIELDMLSAIATKMVEMKHPAFAEEHEVRRPVFHSIRRDPANQINLREGGNLGFRPYIEIDRAQLDGGTGRLPMKKIIIGPTMHPALTERGLRMLLAKSGYTTTEVQRSKIPLRAAPRTAGS